MLTYKSHSGAVFALIDCNNFFCACERVFQPNLLNQAVVVLSNNDGCVIARSDEAKALGIPMGLPYFELRKYTAKERVYSFSSNFQLYSDMSSRVMSIIASTGLPYEVYSVDEAFIESNVLSQEVGLQLTKQIEEWTGIPTSIGIAPTKTLAKLANWVAKRKIKAACYVIKHIDEAAPLLKSIPISEVWGIGSKTQAKLCALKIKTAFDLAQAPRDLLRKQFNVVVQRTAMELAGESCLDLASIPATKQSITVSRSFHEAITSKDELLRYIYGFASKACEKARKQNLYIGGLQIYMHTSIHKPPTYFAHEYEPFSLPTQDTRNVLALVEKLFQTVYRPQLLYKKAGVLLLDLNQQQPQDIWLNETTSPLMHTIDTINQKLGRETVYYAAQRQLLQNQKQKSPPYTTSWKHLKTVK